MELRKLNKDERVLIIGNTLPGVNYGIGDIGTFVIERTDYCVLNIDDSPQSGATVQRKDILSIGDKVVRGPDWDSRDAGDCGRPSDTDIGVVTGFKHPSRVKGFDVRVDWPHFTDVSCRMTADHQDLKPTGDSVDTEENKLKIKPKYVCCHNCTVLECNTADIRTVGGTCIHKQEGQTITKPECFGRFTCYGHGCSTCPNLNFNAETNCACDLERCLYARDCRAKHYDEENIQVVCESTTPESTKPTCNDYQPIKETTPMNNTTETFDRLERANHIKLVEAPKVKNKIKAAQEEEGLLKDEMARLLEYPTLYSEKIGVLKDCASTDQAISAKATIRALELGLPVTINVKS